MLNKRIKFSLVLTAMSLALFTLSACTGKVEETPTGSPKTSDSGRIVKVIGDGNLSAPFQRSLTFGTSGRIAEISVKEGDRVSKGQVLATLEATSEKQAVRAAELAVKNAELNVKTAEIDLEIATDSYKKITYPYTYYTFALGVPESLGAISEAQSQVRQIRETMSQNMTAEDLSKVSENLRKIEEKLITAKEKLGRGEGPDLFTSGQLPIASFWTLRDAQLAMEKAGVALERSRFLLEQARNDLDKATSELEKTVITAPFDSIVASMEGKVGELLAPLNYATEIIVEVIDPQHMELTVRVDEIDIPRVKLGQRAVVSVDALPDIKLDGKVAFIALVATKQTGVVMYDVKIDFDIPSGILVRAGMSASAQITVE